MRTYDDLDALAGTWTKAEADAFADAVAPFGHIDLDPFAAEPKTTHRIGPAAET